MTNLRVLFYYISNVYICVAVGHQITKVSFIWDIGYRGSRVKGGDLSALSIYSMGHFSSISSINICDKPREMTLQSMEF